MTADPLVGDHEVDDQILKGSFRDPDVMDAEKEGLLTDMEVTQICASRSRVLGQYHMMTGMNPVYIISAGGKEDGFGNFDHGDLQRKRENSGGVRTYGGISGSK